jgi:hypothetical protein
VRNGTTPQHHHPHNPNHPKRCRTREEALGGVVDWLVGTTASSQNDRPALLPGTDQPVDDAVMA